MINEETYKKKKKKASEKEGRKMYTNSIEQSPS
jgi:hypothetical protein